MPHAEQSSIPNCDRRAQGRGTKKAKREERLKPRLAFEHEWVTSFIHRSRYLTSRIAGNEMAEQKIAVYSLSDLKNTTDDALPNYLTSLKFKQSHFLTDVRLALGYTAVTIAAVLFYADYRLGWDATRVGTFWAVLVYFTLNGALTVWIWGIEKGKIFIGERDGTLLSIASTVTKHTPIYNVTVRHQNGAGMEETQKISAPFMKWFDVNGVFIAKPFQQWLASEISAIGQADPVNASGAETNAARAKEEADQQPYGVHGKLSSSETLSPGTKPRRGKKP